MKRAMILVMVLALLAGIGYFGFYTQASADSDSSRGASKDAVLVTIADNFALGPGETFGPGKWIDVKPYGDFKVYARLLPGPSGPPPTWVPPDTYGTSYWWCAKLGVLSQMISHGLVLTCRQVMNAGYDSLRFRGAIFWN